MDRYFLGCPVWQCDAWRGNLLPTPCTRSDSLRHYSQVFNAVEGNSTFYAIPRAAVVQRWARETPASFRFVLKFPRVITHELQLRQAQRPLAEFLDRLTILQQAGRLGPSFLQLPPSFSPRQLTDLERFLSELPNDLPYAVEVRHADFFVEPAAGSLNEILQNYGVDRVIFDSRPLYSQPASDAAEAVSQRRKPRLPVCPEPIGERPLVRLIGRNRVAEVEPWIAEWAVRLASWMEAGRIPILFAHTPDDTFAPVMARRFHERLRQLRPDLPPLAAWPGEQEPKQRSLF